MVKEQMETKALEVEEENQDKEYENEVEEDNKQESTENNESAEDENQESDKEKKEDQSKKETPSFVKHLIAFGYPCLVVIAFLLTGFLIDKSWRMNWLLLLTIPVYWSGLVALYKKEPLYFLFPVLAIAIYLFIGLAVKDNKGWHPFWIMLFEIPLYYVSCYLVKAIIQPKEEEEEFVEEEEVVEPEPQPQPEPEPTPVVPVVPVKVKKDISHRREKKAQQAKPKKVKVITEEVNYNKNKRKVKLTADIEHNHNVQTETEEKTELYKEEIE